MDILKITVYATLFCAAVVLFLHGGLWLICNVFRSSVADYTKISVGEKVRANGRSAIERAMVTDLNVKSRKEYYLSSYDELIDEDPLFANLIKYRLEIQETSHKLKASRRKKLEAAIDQQNESLEISRRNYETVLTLILEDVQRNKEKTAAASHLCDGCAHNQTNKVAAL